MHRTIAVAAASMAGIGAAVGLWRHDPRIGSTFVNSTVNPWLLRRGLAGGTHAEIGPIEHIGRTSGVRRLAPVHPEATPDGFRIMVPLGSRSEWARNVVAAGRCRLQLHGHVYELTDPRLVAASRVDGLPRTVGVVLGALGVRYLTLRTVSVAPGTLQP